MPRISVPNTSAKFIKAAERLNQALELRKAGAAYRVIAEKCGYKNAHRAREAVKRAIERLPKENAEDVKRIEEERLDKMILTRWERMLKGDDNALDRILKVMARRAKLLGLDAAEKREHTIEYRDFAALESLRGKLLSGSSDN